jgi:hypothetical protein
VIALLLFALTAHGQEATDARIKSTLGLDSFDRLELDLSQVLPGQPFDFEVKIEGRTYDVVMFPWSVRSPEFRLWRSGVAGQVEEVAAPLPKTYRGSVRGMPESRVAGSLVRGRLQALIIFHPLDSISWYVQPLPGEEAHIVYSNYDSDIEEPWTDIDLPRPGGDDPPPDDGDGFIFGPPSGNFYLTELAIDADWELYGKNNFSVADTVDDVESVLNAMDLIYERDTRITWEITEIVVRTEEGVPYPTNLTHPGYLLEGFRFWWNKHHQAVYRDVAHLMTGKNLDGSVIGVGWDRVICDSIIDGYGYSLSKTRFHTNFNYRVTVTTHEIAHNYGVNGHCDNQPECYIMCSYLGQCDGIGLPNFSPWSIGKITQLADTLNCLDLVPDDAIALVSVDASTGADALSIDLSPPDRNGKTDGLIPFTRSYYENTNVTVTAPLEYYNYWMLWRFERWKLDGAAQPYLQNELLLTTQAWETSKAKADYKRAGKMTVTTKPIDGVNILVDPPDLDGQASGQTGFDLTYFLYDEFTLQAPAKVGRYKFKRWIVNDVPQPIGQTLVTATIPLMSDGTARAVYLFEPTKEDPKPSGGGKNKPR